ncbi:MAG: O-methyltransferase [Ignavibacteria bacterium]|nr:O-methyltransferase [Ignavibacteria bacterium]MBK7157019.1 O-methyltransferase [Ignavibacteria bacterium]MBK7255954.1 O-methyltransferase [Ignavibacteria bacterium]MBK8383710.1 O-methyltransferase [Ignavibacteria bacterium]MBK9403797.1 O-methyltransferase [Ignavibacteria bacterium]
MKKMKSVPLNEELYNYILERFVPEDSLLNELISETEALNIPLIQISPEQGKFLTLICKLCNAKNALEIGTLTGFSGIHIARGLKENGKLVTVEIEQKHGDTAKKYFEKAGLKDKTEVVISPALDYMKILAEENKSFDFIFIDANKTNYPDYLEMAIKLSHPGTAITMDNMIKNGRVIEDAGDDEDLRFIQLTNDILSKDDRIETLLVPIGDGITLSVVK